MAHQPDAEFHTWPFRYWHMRNVYEASVYEALALAMEVLVETNQCARKIPGYDAGGAGFLSSSPAPLAVFHSPAQRDWLNSLFGVPNTPYLSAGAHFHKRHSKSGFIHNDYNPGWFPVSHEAIQEVRSDLCHYKTGKGPLPDHAKVQTIRGVGMIFYVGNDPWAPGDGGETGLYLHEDDPVDQPVVAIPPLNNSLFAYECTPQSWHSFITNTKSTRTNIIMWTHRLYAEAVAQHGEEGIEAWRNKYL